MRKTRMLAILTSLCLCAAGCGGCSMPAAQSPADTDIAATEPTFDNEKRSVPFTLGVYLHAYREDWDYERDFAALIVRSAEELRALYAKEGEDVADYTAPYTEEFFRDRALVFIFKSNTSGSIRDQVTALTREGKRLTVAYTTWKPSMGTADMALWRIVLEVDKADVEGITEILPLQTETGETSQTSAQEAGTGETEPIIQPRYTF